jgi:sulfur carrier protein
LKLTVNGETMDLGEQVRTVKDLLAKLSLAGGEGPSRVAVAVNLEVIPRARHAEHALREGDRVEIIHAVGGG